MEQSFDNYQFGAVQSPRDYRDIGLADVLVPVALPDTFFVDTKNLPVWYQKKIGSCGGHAIGKYGQKLEEAETGKVIATSPRFMYALAKCNDNYVPEGTYLRILMKMAQQYGFATENTVPNDCDLTHEEYVYNRKIENIPKEAFEEAKQYKIKSYASVGLSLNEIKQAIYQAKGCIILVRVGNPWWTDVNGNVTWNPTGLLPLRPPQVVTGGHFVYANGYKLREDGKTEIHFVNSWSAAWCEKGTGWFIFEDYSPFINEAMTIIDLPDNFIEEAKKLPVPSEFKHLFIGTIKYGQENEEVRALQIALKIDGCFPQTKKETGFYGPTTQQAVKAFQTKYSVASWLELKRVNGKTVGVKTIAKLNSLYHK